MYPKINEILFIHINSSDEKEANTEYKSRITDLDEKSILIEIPIQEKTGHLKRLHLGDELSVNYIREDGIKHYFNTYVLGHKEDVIRMVRIHKPDLENISKIQRRTFLRVQADLEISVTTKNMTRFIARTEDVGGGGLSFYGDAKYNLKEGESLSCWILVNYKNGSVEHIPLNAEIVRIKNQEQSRNLVMLKFTDILDMERQKIIRYCFERQFDFRNR